VILDPDAHSRFEEAEKVEMLSQQILEEVTRRIVDAIHPERIILFGSHAWGLPSEDSDIDLLIVLSNSNKPGYRRARDVYRSLRGLKLPVDVVVRTLDEVERGIRVKTSLERKVLEEGRVLHG
jgi:predicted nucleotidyltransferase